jgi:Flp pilus assembly protein TadD
MPPAIPKVPPAIPPAIPKSAATPAKGSPIVAPKPAADLADLPAPKRPSPLADQAASKAPPRSALAEAELPAPKSAAKPPSAPPPVDLDDLMPSAPSSSAASVGLADLPAPKAKPSPLADLPAPKAKEASALADLPAPKAKPASPLGDLPSPKAKASEPAAAKTNDLDLDLPAPKAKAKSGLDLDLPAPKAKGGLDLDLPTPKGPAPGSLDLDPLDAPGLELDDLPAPKAGSAPATNTLDDDLDLPMPAADLPMPKSGGADLRAPKGVFDDLPAPKKGGATGGIDLPAPKGFFDDLPQPAAAKPASASNADLPAPKGFFDDLPAPKSAASGGGGGFFDDLPQPKAAPPAAGGGGAFGDLDLGLPADKPLQLDGDEPAGDLDLGLPSTGDSDFGGLDLSAPSARPAQPIEPGSPIKIKTPKGGAPSTPIPIVVPAKPPTAADLKLDLADEPLDARTGKPTSTTGAKPGDKKAKLTPEQQAELRAKKKKRSQLTAAAVLGVALAGAGGFYFYRKHTAAQERAAKIDDAVTRAQKALRDGSPSHWSKAAKAATEALEIDPNNARAIGIGAEAKIAGALDNGEDYESRVKQGRKLVQQGLGAGKASPEIERAQAVMAIAGGQPDRAIPMLTRLIGQSPKDGWLQLYLGWAQLAIGDADAALEAFDQAVALEPNAKLPALYGHGRAKLLKTDIAGAQADFAEVLKIDSKHAGAQVAMTETLPPQQTAQREAELRAILSRPDLDKADPRAITRTHVLLGDIARTSGRLDIARDSYGKALKLTPNDVAANTGLAAVELREGKVQVARDLVAKALAAKADDAQAQLLDAEADIAEGKLNDADGKLGKLAARQPPLPPLQLARLHVLEGKLFDAQGKAEEAIAEYIEGSKLAGDLDLTPTMAAVTKLSELAKKAPDEATAVGYRARADELLSKLAEKAKEDGEVAMTLGVAYLQAGDAAKAEDMLRRATTMREKDPESRLQLAKALAALHRTDDAIATLKEAAALDPTRGDIALELARTYQNAGRDNEAMTTFEKLLADPAVPAVVRVAAGRYFASRGAFDKAAAQADPILTAEPDNQGGLYLKGEGQLIAKQWNEARITLTRATDLDSSDAQALDALGRAFEGSLAATGDGKFIESARHAYDRATKADPKLFHAWLGLGRMLLAARHADEAVAALQQAIALDKTSSEAMYELGLAAYDLRKSNPANMKASVQWFDSALRAKPELSDDEKAEAYWHLGDLYFDLNRPGESARAWEEATRIGEEIEKNTAKGPVWLTETYYRLGQDYKDNGPALKRVWSRYISRNPAPGVEKQTALQWLATTGKNF